MRKLRVFLVIALMVSAVLAIGYKKSEVDIASTVLTMPKEPLSDKEIEGLMQMVEEEKLARDVYLKLYEMWKVQIFKNISGSEQVHMNAVVALIEKYGLENPIEKLKIGEFASKEMKELYEKLIDQGSKSLIDALKVGMAVEDLDIKDLNDLLKLTDNADIKFVYENLKKGSQNHLRSFYEMLTRYGGTYSPQYISKDEFEEIIQGNNSRGNGQSRGGRGKGRR